MNEKSKDALQSARELLLTAYQHLAMYEEPGWEDNPEELGRALEATLNAVGVMSSVYRQASPATRSSRNLSTPLPPVSELRSAP